MNDKPYFDHTQHTLVYIKFVFCIFVAGLTLYLYINSLNELTVLRLEIPYLVKQVKSIRDENMEIEYEIERFESPIHLMELLKKPEFSHLHYPYVRDVRHFKKKMNFCQMMPSRKRLTVIAFFLLACYFHCLLPSFIKFRLLRGKNGQKSRKSTLFCGQ